jgi:hypothetical protein
MIGVVGGYGAVGSVAAGHLATVGAVRIGGRDPLRTKETADRIGAEPKPVDVSDPDSMAAFADGCDLVVNCAGPAHAIGATVARATARAGADYVDAAGDDALYAAVETVWENGSAIISAGMMPGLTGILPRALAATVSRPVRLTGWVGGRDRFTVTAAEDYLASAADFGQALAVWRGGRRVADRTGARNGVTVSFFPGPVAVTPYLSTEAERVATVLGVPDAAWYSVFDGEHLWQALTRPADTGVAQRARQLSRAADLDLFGTGAYQLVVVEVAGVQETQTLVLRGTGASALTGLTAALTARAVRGGAVPAGVHHAADVLDPQWTVERLRGCPEVSALERYDGPAQRYASVEEGAL